MSTRIDLKSTAEVPVGAKLLKTGQIISYATGDDGATQRGRETNFLTLASNNPFGNTNRFTDKTGGQTYTTNVTLDWSTYDNSTVLAYYFGDTTSRNWATQLTQYTGSTIDGLNGWNLINFQEISSLVNSSLWLNYMLNYPPFSTTRRYFWISSGPTGTTGIATDLASAGIFIGVNKANTYNGIWVRVCNVSGTTIS